jgi:hypothetical protein
MMTPDEQLEYRAGVNEPEWDYHFCRCENNGDLCDYCQRFEDREPDIPEEE